VQGILYRKLSGDRLLQGVQGILYRKLSGHRLFQGVQGILYRKLSRDRVLQGVQGIFYGKLSGSTNFKAYFSCTLFETLPTPDAARLHAAQWLFLSERAVQSNEQSRAGLPSDRW
jgi:hypothetical protein